MLPVRRTPSAIGERLIVTQGCPAPAPASHRVVGGAVVGSWTGFRQDALERLGAMEEAIRMQVAMTSVALGRTNLVLARAIEDLEGVSISESEEGRME